MRIFLIIFLLNAVTLTAFDPRAEELEFSSYVLRFEKESDKIEKQVSKENMAWRGYWWP